MQKVTYQKCELPSKDGTIREKLETLAPDYMILT